MDQKQEVEIGIDVTGDRKPDLWIKLRGREKDFALAGLFYCLGVLSSVIWINIF